ncbi:MAG: hypothetical protein U0670_21010 [Anaerolineae bacterium]
MTYLDRPRAHFFGKVSVNMPTGNNATADTQDRPYFDPDQVTLDPLGGTPAQFREWLHQLNPTGYVNGGWNLYGDNSIHFDHVRIHSVELPDQTLLSDSAQDRVIGSVVSLLGSEYYGTRTGAVLVDLDPNDGFTTQMFAEEFRLSLGDNALMTAVLPVKTYSRWVNLWRNLALGGDRGSSAVWHLAFPPESLNYSAVGSPFLTQLQAFTQQGYGICIRLCTYLFHHRPYREIASRYRQGDRFSLPGEMVVIGTLGTWIPGEPATLPAARLLVPNLEKPLPLPADTRTQRRGQTFYLGAALAQVDVTRKVITLDLVNTFPEIAGMDTLDTNDPRDVLPERINLGTLSLQVRATDTPTYHCIGVLAFDNQTGVPAYNKNAYLQNGGIVEISYDPDLEHDILEQDLHLLHGVDDSSPVLLAETPYHVIVDQRGLYLELEDQTALDVPIQLLMRGRPSPAGVLLTAELSSSHPTQSRETASDADRAAIGETAAGVVTFSPIMITDEEGRGIVRLQAERAGIGKLWLIPPGEPDWTQTPETVRYFLRAGLSAYVNVRVLPDDRHFDALTDAELTWDTLYTEVFRYYSLLYPIMNAYINFDDQVAITAAADRIVQFISPETQNTTLYMPITRDLSNGKRRLIERWAAQVRGTRNP